MRLNEQVSSNQHIHASLNELKETLIVNAREAESSQIAELTTKLHEVESRASKAEESASQQNAAANAVSIEMAKKDHEFAIGKQELQSKIDAEKSRSDGLEEELKSIHVTIAALEVDKKFVEKRLCEKDEEVVRLQKYHVEHEATTDNLKAELDRSKGALQRATEAKASLEKQLDDANVSMREMQKTLTAHEMDSVKKDGELRKLTLEIETVAADLEKTRDLLHAEREVAKTLRASVLKMEGEASDACARHSREISTCKREAETAREEMENMIRSLQEENSRTGACLQQTNAELEGARSDVAQFRSTVGSQEGALTALKSQMMAVEVKLSAQSEIAVERANVIADLEAEIEKKAVEIATLEEQAHADEDERRKLHNALQELKGNIRVFCRVRPVLQAERSSDASMVPVFQYHTKSRGISAVLPDRDAARSLDGQASSPYEKKFKFDRVFGPTSTQDDVFGEISQLVQSALDGYRVCIFAYGQTGSGKTHTIMGNEDDLGMIPRSVNQIFERAERMAKDQWTFELRASFLEIYNEKIRDLLVRTRKTSPPSAKGPKGKGEYEITFDTNANRTNIEGLTVTTLSKPEDAARLIATAAKNRSTAATLSNEESSRSHSVFRLYITGRNGTSGQKLSGVLNLVDLAGSERVKISGAEGDRLRESKAINKSLSQLSTVIQSLANRDKHVPYRSSKLTRVLQDSLGGDSKTLMFVNVAPVPASYNESLCSLRFAEQVNACEIGTAKRSTKITLSADDDS